MRTLSDVCSKVSKQTVPTSQAFCCQELFGGGEQVRRDSQQQTLLLSHAELLGQRFGIEGDQLQNSIGLVSWKEHETIISFTMRGFTTMITLMNDSFEMFPESIIEIPAWYLLICLYSWVAWYAFMIFHVIAIVHYTIIQYLKTHNTLSTGRTILKQLEVAETNTPSLLSWRCILWRKQHKINTSGSKPIRRFFLLRPTHVISLPKVQKAQPDRKVSGRCVDRRRVPKYRGQGFGWVGHAQKSGKESERH